MIFRGVNKDQEMSFLGHLEVLRWHLIRCAIAVVLGALIAFFFTDFIFTEIILGPKKADFVTYRLFCHFSQMLSAGEIFCLTNDLNFNIQNTIMGGQFSMHMWSCAVVGTIISFPYIVFEIWKFIKPALYSNERKNTTGAVFYISLLFIIGVCFGYFVVTPLSVNFLANYVVSDIIKNDINISSYLSVITMITLASGLLFELPIFIFFLSKIGLVTPATLRKYRRHAIVLNLVASAIITPPDIMSQTIVAIPLAILYEVGIVISGRVEKKRLETDSSKKEISLTKNLS